MPTYKFLNKLTGEEFSEFMSITECNSYLKDNPHLEQLVNGFPVLGYSIVRGKPADGFRDLLKSIKKGNKGSKIDTW